MTQRALKSTKEWNIKITSLEDGELIKETNDEFERMWESAEDLTEQWISDEYEPLYKNWQKHRDNNKVQRLYTSKLKPNLMQIEASRALAKMREKNQTKALLISATGTGKTYLSAFDVRNFKPNKMLFLVHRDRILDQAIESYKKVLGENIRVGKLSSKSTNKDYEADYIFATMATMARDEYRLKYATEYFDYIIVDETHRAAAESYQKILNYFRPKFLLGMTATPELSGGKDIYDIYNHNVAYEIRLQQAMENNLLCPFHYFGISELKVGEIEYKEKDFKEVFPYLVSDERVNHIIKYINFYSYSGERVHGLVFCRRIEEAKELSKAFNQRGYNTMVVSSGADMIFQGKKLEISDAIDLLEQKKRSEGLDYIFTVDMFNEGIDIPNINQVIMLRPTQSPVVFVQQLGRGLRKSPNKEYVVVLDFIGNYANNFMIPIALSGDRTYNKDTIRKYILEGNRVLPGCSTIHFDQITKEQIFKSINKMKGLRKIIKDGYDNLKLRIGHIPTMMEFYESGEIDPILILNEYKTYFNFLKVVETEYSNVQMDSRDIVTLEYLSGIVARGKRPHEIEIMTEILCGEETSNRKICNKIDEKYGLKNQEKSVESALLVLKGTFVDKENFKKYEHIDIITESETGCYRRMSSFSERVKKVEFNRQVNDIVALGRKRYEDLYAPSKYTRNQFVLYQKYSRRDVCLLLNLKKGCSATMYGMKRIEEDVMIFVTYNKDLDDDGQRYKDGKPDYGDEFLEGSNQMFMWDTQIGKGIRSAYYRDVVEAKRRHLFIKKNDAEGADYYYIGLCDIIEATPSTKQDKNGKNQEIVKIKYKLHDPVQEDLKEYLCSKV